MSKHTPAPWNIHPNYTEIKPLAVVQEDGRGFVAWSTYVARGTKIIAEVRGNSSSMGWGFVDNQFEIEANARLIASAPELLEALKLGVLAIGEHNAPHDCYSTGPITGTIADYLCPACSYLNRAKELIAKAEAL